QAEDGIRDGHVTGVQTCALPISRCADDRLAARHVAGRDRAALREAVAESADVDERARLPVARRVRGIECVRGAGNDRRVSTLRRSEERRVGKEGWSGGGRWSEGR